MSKRKILACIYLPIVAALPVFLGVCQVTHFLDWLFDWGFSFEYLYKIHSYSPFFLVLCFLISWYEHFCIYHRMVILSVLYCNLSCFFVDTFPSIEAYNISNIIAIMLIVVGVVGCLIHFSYQINDFIRYVRTKR